MVKRLPAMRETRVRFLGQEDPLEKEMAIHTSTLAWKIPWTEEPDRVQSMGPAKSRTRLSDFTLFQIPERAGNVNYFGWECVHVCQGEAEESKEA